MNFTTATKLGLVLWDSAAEYDRWAQAEQARLLVEYLEWLELAADGGCSPRASAAKVGAS